MTTSTTSQRSGLSSTALALIPIAIAINVALGQLVQSVLKLPIYLDSIGTVLVGVLLGPLAGAITGVLANVIWGLTLAPSALPFAAVAAVIGLIAGYARQYGAMQVWWKMALAGVITGVVAAAISAPIAAYVFGGVTGAGTDVLVAIFQNFGASVLGASFMQGAVSDPLDKTITYLIVWAIISALPKRLLARFGVHDK
ncbi:ECF transporter S component [Roseiflexus castenholzii]|jgi:energy-coupling factor transport system substrate-specific component|uniref:Signal transduction histidine kinase, LytS n=1 Tax=Roseiflexus castenholzii (strain DSM 13941 / HLO8) TaxID=383372 RepID=A7NS77_ROSCS|nr:ECF transporter S component [Roseiflexus castenholzii]ABU60423.1 signal transduction histidine kinase, LytS [Roseiflexus castenholzii DSM 13941]